MVLSTPTKSFVFGFRLRKFTQQLSNQFEKRGYVYGYRGISVRNAVIQLMLFAIPPEQRRQILNIFLIQIRTSFHSLVDF